VEQAAKGVGPLNPVIGNDASEKPVPAPDRASAAFWEAAQNHVLVVQRCESCGLAQYPPDLICRRCQSDSLAFVNASGLAKVYSFAIYTRPFMTGFEVPYVLALIDLDDYPTVRMMTNIVETPIDQVAIGMQVEVTFENRRGWALPQFRALRPTAG
jgi:uncharacterized OB-fold protein